MNRVKFFKGNMVVFASVAVALLIAAGIIAWLMFGGAGPMEVVMDNGVKAKFAATLKNTEISREKEGKMIWHFNVDDEVNDQVSDKTILHGIKGKVYRGDGSYFDVVAQNGEMVNGRQDFMVRDQVSAVLSSDKSKLTADMVTWEDKKQRVTATGNVQLWKDDWYARGDKAVTTGSFKKIRLIGHAYVERR